MTFAVGGAQLVFLASITLKVCALGDFQAAGLNHVLERSTVNDMEQITDLTNALKHVVERHLNFECDTVSFKLQWSTETGRHLLLDMVNDVVPVITAHAITISTPERNFYSEKETHFVWLFDTLESFVVLDGQLKERSADNPNFGDGVYLLVYVLPSAEKEVFSVSEKVQRSLRTFNELNLFGVNVVLNAPNVALPGEVLFYTYLPFQAGQCGLVKPQLINIFRHGSLLYKDIFLRRKVNFQRCPFRVMALMVDPFVSIENGSNKLTGFEGEVVNTIVDKLNASLELLPQPKEASSVLAGGEGTGFFRQLRNNEGDFIVGLQFLSALKVKYFKPSVSYYTTRQILVLRKGNDAYSNSNWLTSPFTNRTWLWVGLCCAFLIPFGVAMQYTVAIVGSDAERTVSANRYVVLNVIAMILGLSQSSMPTRPIYRMAFATISLSLLVLRSIYQGKIYDDYRLVRMDDAPNTFEELVRRNYSILATYVFDVPEILFQNAENGSGSGGLQVLCNELLPEQNFELLEQHQDHQSGRNAAIITSYDYYSYYVNKHNKQGVFKVLPQHLVSLKGCFYFRGNTYIQKEIDSIINRLEPSGILTSWIEKNVEKPSDEGQRVSHAINMDKIQLVTLWYAYFCILALVVFFCEILLARYWRLKEGYVQRMSPPVNIENAEKIDIYDGPMRVT